MGLHARVLAGASSSSLPLLRGELHNYIGIIYLLAPVRHFSKSSEHDGAQERGNSGEVPGTSGAGIHQENSNSLSDGESKKLQKQKHELPGISKQQAEELVARVLSPELADREAKKQATLRKAATPWKMHDSDSGGSAVQIAQWTEKLKQLEEHMRRYPRDKNAKYVATHIAARRHKMLKYLRRRDFETYFRIIVALGLEDIQPMPFPQKHRFDIHEVLDVKEAVEALEFMKRAGEAGSGKKKAQTQGSNDGQSP